MAADPLTVSEEWIMLRLAGARVGSVMRRRARAEGRKMIRTRPARVVAALAALSLAAVASIVAATPAGAQLRQPRTYTAVLSPTSAPSAGPTDYAVVVKNTSTVLSALDRFVLVVPTGFSVKTGTVTSPRGGWTESVAAGLLTASTSTPLRSGLRKGESMTVRFTATDSVPCDTRKVTWAQKADGILVDPFVPQSPDPTVQLLAVADNVQVTDVTDGSNPPLHRQVRVGAPFTVQGIFRCGTTPAPTSGASTLSLVKTAAGQPDTGGSLGGVLTANVAAGSTSAIVSGATYSAVENQVGIAADWSGGADDSFQLDVFDEVKTVNGTPGVAIPPELLTVSGAQADLGNGANGPVSIVVSACASDQTDTAPCSAGTQVELTGNFKTDALVPLYSFAAPARISWLCPSSTCAHGANGTVETEPTTNYLYNYECPGSDCIGEGTLFGEREVEEDFHNYPIYVSIRENGVDTPFAAAPRCVPLPISNSDPNRSALLHLTGQITNPVAQALGFCADVNAITRTGNLFSGDLRIPVLFVEDFKMRP
jgi:hypothetical protein